MVFVKQTKSKAYFKRYQVKFRRRREGKTDYFARRHLTAQEKNKYNCPKYRFAVRLTSTKVICQIIFATIKGDVVMEQANSLELKKYGINAGLTNYAACYCTGLLLARRLLKKQGLDDMYRGVTNATGAAFDVYEDMEKRQGEGESLDRRPFKAALDVGLIHTTTGNRVFGALKGACDGGLHIPHSTKRFPGTKEEGGKSKYDAEVHKKRIFGLHVQKHMEQLKKDDPEAYQKHFSLWDKATGGKTLEALYKAAHAAIRKDPTHAKPQRAHPPVHTRAGPFIKTHKGKYPRPRRLTREQRKENVKKKIMKASAAHAED
jgi:large subunit ribosomal protein L5e